MTTADIAVGLELLGAAGAGVPGIGPWIAVLARLGATVARAGGSPESIMAIDGAAIARRRAAADVRLDYRAELRDRAAATALQAPDTEPSIYADPNDDERTELERGRR